MNTLRVQALVLRKIPYSETSLIVHTLTEENGRLHFMVKGARRSGKTSFPALDLFRLVELQYREAKNSDLHNVVSADCIKNHDAIAQAPRAYRTAVWLCRFVNLNTHPNIPVPHLFRVLSLALERLGLPNPPCSAALALGLCFTLLEEGGILPDFSHDPATAGELPKLLKFSTDAGADCPPYTQEQWSALLGWTHAFMTNTHITIPEGWNRLESPW